MKWIIRIGVGLLAVIALACAVLFVLGHRANAGRNSASVDINASPAQVWQWLDDPGKLKQWISWVVEVRTPGGPGTGKVGEKRILVMKDENNGGALMEIAAVYTKYTPPSEMALSVGTPGEFHGAQTYKLTDLGNGRTRLELVGQYYYDMWLAQLFEPLITPAAQKKVDMDIARLKTLAETETSANR